jgi:hypothetical protein
MTLVTARQMVGAEMLKLRRNRPIMGLALMLSIGLVLLYFGYNAIEHASNPATNGPAGGIFRFQRAVRVLGLQFGSLVAILIGSEAGTADLGSGVFRDLVATGRSRLALFAVRAPAALIVTLVFNGVAFLISVAATFVFAGGLPTPSLSLILQSAAWILMANALVAAFAVGVGSLTGSRAMTLTAVFGWQVLATQLLLNVPSLGSVRDGLLTAAANQVAPFDFTEGLTMASGVAVAVLVAWLVVPTAVGAWRTSTRDA